MIAQVRHGVVPRTLVFPSIGVSQVSTAAILHRSRSGLLLRRLLGLPLLVVVAACSDEGPGAAGPPASMDVVSGNDQADTVGQELPASLIVLVKDAAGMSVPQLTVNFVVARGGGSVFAGANSTNLDGIAQERWTLGTNTADSQVVEVRAVDNTTGEPRVFARFTAIALPDSPESLSIVEGDAQTGPLGAFLPESLVVRLADQHGNGTPGKVIRWQVLAGNGSPATDSTATGPAGVSATRWALGARIDTAHVLEAAAMGVPAVQFTASPQLPAGTTVTKVAGDAQSDTAGQPLPDSLVVRVALADGRGVQGIVVAWAAVAGSLANADPVTDADGRAAACWTLGTTAGPQLASATASDASAVEFTALAAPDAPATIVAIAGDDQRWLASTELPDPVVARVADQYDNATPGVLVTWQVTEGGGNLEAASPATDPQGQVTARWLLGPSLGANRLAVSVGAITVDFKAIAREPMALVVATTPNWLFSCGLSNTQAPYCWGDNNYGHLGDGTTMDRSRPVAVAGNRAFEQLILSEEHSCGLTATGEAYCWGRNGVGQLGDTSRIDQSTPVPVSGGLAFTTLVSGYQHTCGLIGGGAAYCWGANAYGELGDGTRGGDRAAPSPVAGGIAFTMLSAGHRATCGVVANGVAYCWGDTGVGGVADSGRRQLTPLAVSPTLTFDTVVVSSHFCGVTTGGAAYCWGNNGWGQLGDGTKEDRATPVPVSGGLTFTQLAASSGRTCGLTTSGAAYCWGMNEYGQVGDGTTQDRSIPTAVSGGLTFSRLTLGFWHTCGLTAVATTFCWGRNALGQLGDGTTMDSHEPVAVSGGLRLTTLTSGGEHVCGVTAEGVVYCWGRNTQGQLGDGSSTQRSATPVRAWP
jgi:alpha-tubulin suppressor-like RCC1 family protein